MHATEIEAVLQNGEAIRRSLPESFTLADLGCGDGKHTFMIMESAKLRDRISSYCPVDISDIMLNEATKTAYAARYGPAPNGCSVDRIKRNFVTELDQVVAGVSREKPTLYLLGATYSNFDRDEMLSLFRKSIRPIDYLYVSAQLLADGASVQRQYLAKGAETMVTDVVRSLGFDRTDVTFFDRYNSERREMELYFLVNRVPEELAEKYGVKQGDEIVVLYSYKPRFLDFENQISKYFDGIVFTNEKENYAGFIGQLRRLEEPTKEPSSA